jgi:urocanate hydratase
MAAYRAPRQDDHCANWQIEAAYRMVQNNLDAEVAEDPERLIVYGGLGKAARNPEALQRISRRCAAAPEQTMLVQSGKWSACSRRTAMRRACCSRTATSSATGRTGTSSAGSTRWVCHVWPDDGGLVDLHRHAGHRAGTYETFVAAGKRHFGGDLKGGCAHGGARRHGRRAAAGRCDGGRVCLAADVDRSRIEKRLKTRYLDELVEIREPR